MKSNIPTCQASLPKLHLNTEGLYSESCIPKLEWDWLMDPHLQAQLYIPSCVLLQTDEQDLPL